MPAGGAIVSVGAAADDEGTVAILSLQETDQVLFNGPAAEFVGLFVIINMEIDSHL